TTHGVTPWRLRAVLMKIRTSIKTGNPTSWQGLVVRSSLNFYTQREADIFLGFFEPDTENLRAEKIGAFSCHLYGSPAYFARHGAPDSVESLSQHVFVGYIENLIQLDAVRWLENGVKDPTIVYRSNSMISQMFAAVAGTGLVMLPVFSRPERFGLLPVLHDRVRVHRDVWMSTLRHFPRVPRINAVLSFLTSIFARDHPPAA
ncbi:LysR substrate-binding domain-containing protein, partial [Burkholderia gladioli]|uniref:LysR substrate-binding domain-containing protein n=1 Tax=Burkholderia gladioli TaxID=28095 RepID=UPI001FC8A097